MMQFREISLIWKRADTGEQDSGGQPVYVWNSTRSRCRFEQVDSDEVKFENAKDFEYASVKYPGETVIGQNDEIEVGGERWGIDSISRPRGFSPGKNHHIEVMLKVAK